MTEETESTETVEVPEKVRVVKSPIDEKLDETRMLVERMEKANAELERNIERAVELKIENTLAGKSTTGNVKPEDESPEDYAKRMLGGVR